MGNYLRQIQLIWQTGSLSCTLDELPKRKTTKILNFQFQQMKAYEQKPPTSLASDIITKDQGIGKEIVTSVSVPGTFNLQTAFPKSS